MTRFVKVQDQCATYNVPTKEEYEDYRGKVNKSLSELQARITTLECRTANVGEKRMFDFGTAKECSLLCRMVQKLKAILCVMSQQRITMATIKSKSARTLT